MADLNFDFKPNNSFEGLAQLLATKGERQQAVDQNAAAQRQSQFKMVVDAASNTVQSFVEASKRRQQKDAINMLANVMGEPKKGTVVGQEQSALGTGPSVPASSTAVPQLGQTGGVAPGLTNRDVTYDETPMGQSHDSRLLAAATKVDPQEAAKTMFQNAFPKPMSAANRSMPQPIKLKNGDNVLAVYDQGTKTFYYPNTETPIPAELIDQRAYSPSSEFKVITDPTTKKQYRLNVADNTLSEEISPVAPVGEPYYKRSLDEKKEIKSATENILNDDVLKASTANLVSLGNTSTVFNQDLSASRGAIKSLVARVIAGEKGVLTDKDVERVTGSADIANRFNNLVRTIYDGRATNQDFAEFQSLMGTIKDRTSELYEQSFQQGREALQTQYGISEKEANTLLRYRPADKILNVKSKRSIPTTPRAGLGIAGRDAVDEGAPNGPQIIPNGAVDLGSGFSYTVK